MGASRQVVYKWRYSQALTQSKNDFKRNLIERAGELFCLDRAEREALANKAGLSLDARPPPGLESSHSIKLSIKPTHNIKPSHNRKPTHNTEFSKHFNHLLSTYITTITTGKKIDLCEDASVSDRMFRHIKSGRHLRKESILALLIVMGLSLDEIQCALKKAGLILSRSIPGDAVIIWMLENDLYGRGGVKHGVKRLYRINEVLDSFGLGLLMTREWG